MAQYSSVDLLTLKGLVKVNEIDTKIVSPNTTGDTVKIDASDHNEVDTAILDLIGHTMDSTFNRVDGINLAEIIEGTADGQVLVWDVTTSTWLLSTSAGATPVGNTYEVQMKGVGNTFLSDSNFTYDTVLDNFLVQNSGFTANDSIVKLKLPTTAGLNLLITADAAEVNNLLEIDVNANLVNIGAIDSTVTLRRGSSSLDESLILSNELLNISNANVAIKSASNIDGDALKVLNSSDVNLKTYSNDGRVSRDVDVLQVDGVNITTVDTEDVTITYDFSDSGFTRFATGKLVNFTLDSNTVSNNRNVTAYSQVFTETGLTQGTSDKIGFSQVMVGGTPSSSYYGNSMFLSGGNTRGQVSDHTIQNGYSYMTGSSNIGFESQYQVPLSGNVSLLRLGARNFNASGQMIPVGSGVQIQFYHYIYRDPSNGNINSAPTDYLGVRVADDQFATVTTEMYFKTTQDRLSVEPLKLTGKDVTIGTLNSIIQLKSLPIAADNTAALALPLTVDTVYRTVTGELRIVI